MAGNLTGPELAAMRAELDQVNEKSGFKRHDRDGGPAVAGPAEAPSPAEAKPEPVADPGPPRFLGVDLERKLVGLSGGGVIAIDDATSKQIVDLLLVQLQLHLTRALGEVARTHGADPAQLEIPFPDGRTD